MKLIISITLELKIRCVDGIGYQQTIDLKIEIGAVRHSEAAASIYVRWAHKIKTKRIVLNFS